jgi:hypothetical protein
VVVALSVKFVPDLMTGVAEADGAAAVAEVTSVAAEGRTENWSDEQPYTVGVKLASLSQCLPPSVSRRKRDRLASQRAVIGTTCWLR